MNSGLAKFALEYLNKWKFSVIPLLPNKKPLIPWEEFQHRLPTEKEVTQWFVKYDTCMIGVVTGEISNLAVIDIDTEDIPMEFANILFERDEEVPLVKTPRGWHYYFKYADGLTNTVDIFPNFDMRAEGGYVVAPPSVTEDGKKYRWETSLIIGLPKFPIEILSEPESSSTITLREVYVENKKMFAMGHRDNDLFHVAHHLIKGGMSPQDATTIVTRLASTCDPPFPESEAVIKVDSAVKRAVRKERPLAKEIEEFVMSTDGYFSTEGTWKNLQLFERQDQKNVSVILGRLRERGVIEKHGAKHGVYRRVERELLDIDWRNADIKPLEIKLPLGLDTMVNLYDGDIIVIAGESNAGKSGMCLSITEQNMNNWEVHYFSSELGAAKLRKRISLTDVPQDEWKFFPHDKSSDYHHFLFDGAINIVDFVIVTDNFWEVGGIIKDIHFALRGKKGIAIICIQKDPKKEFGRGGDITRELASLYITLSQPGVAKIVKLKDWKGNRNPNRQIVGFKLHQAYKFESIGDWHNE